MRIWRPLCQPNVPVRWRWVAPHAPSAANRPNAPTGDGADARLGEQLDSSPRLPPGQSPQSPLVRSLFAPSPSLSPSPTPRGPGPIEPLVPQGVLRPKAPELPSNHRDRTTWLSIEAAGGDPSGHKSPDDSKPGVPSIFDIISHPPLEIPEGAAEPVVNTSGRPMSPKLSALKRLESADLVEPVGLPTYSQDYIDPGASLFEDVTALDAEYKEFDAEHFYWWRGQLARIGACIPLEPSLPEDVHGISQKGETREFRRRWEVRWDMASARAWGLTMLAVLHHHPTRAHRVIRAMAHFSPLSYMVEDVVLCLLKWQVHCGRPWDEIQPYADYLCRVVGLALNRFGPIKCAIFSGPGLGALYNHCSLDVALRLRAKLEKYGANVSKLATVQLVARISVQPEYRDLAILELAKLCRSPPPVDPSLWWPIVASITTKIISTHTAGGVPVAKTKPRATVTPEAVEAKEKRLALSAELMNKLVDGGLSLNLIHYTAWIRSMCLEGEPGMALQVAESLLAQNLKVDKYVYSILLNGAKNHQDFDVMERTLQLASKQGLMGRFLWNDILHTIFTYWNEEQGDERKKQWRTFQRRPCFHYMLEYYTRIYDLQPLEHMLGSELASHTRKPAQTHDSPTTTLFSLLDRYLEAKPAGGKVKPGTDTLVIMLLAFLQDAQRSAPVTSFFTRFGALLEGGDKLARRMVAEQTVRIHNGVIKRLGEFRRGDLLLAARDIFATMLAKPPQPEDSPDGAPTTPPPPPAHPRPDVRTWSILIQSYFLNGQTVEAAKLARLMREHGVEPNLVTWNTVASGHAYHQDYNASMAAVREIHARRMQPDHYTSAAVLRLNNHDRTLEMLRELETEPLREEEERLLREEVERQQASMADGEDEKLQRELDYLARWSQPSREADWLDDEDDDGL